METHKHFTHQDKDVLKSVFRAYPRATCVVDLQKQEAYLLSNGKKIATIEKHPDQWGIRTTAEIKVNFSVGHENGKPIIYAYLKSIYQAISVKIDSLDALNFIGRRFIIPVNQYFTFTPDKKHVLFACIDGIEFEIKRTEWNKMASFVRNVDYKTNYL